ncbi:MAG: signal peptidase II [Peptococcaceae bacterium]|nr:signal peptidase II [Peptococcaceae bacterium]
MLFFIAAAVFLLDQASKLAVQAAMYHGESIPVAPPVFFITYVLNPGAAFGLLANQNTLFISVSVILVLGVLVAYKRVASSRAMVKAALGLVVGGALGNLVDRLRFGMVVDFLDFRVWPVFNLADSAIVVGAVLLAWEILKNADGGGRKKEPKLGRG